MKRRKFKRYRSSASSLLTNLPSPASRPNETVSETVETEEQDGDSNRSADREAIL